MKVRAPYSDNFEKIQAQTLFRNLDRREQEVVRTIAFDNRFALRELASFVESSIDLNMWNEKSRFKRWMQWRQESDLHGREFKKWAFARQQKLLKNLVQEETRYGTEESFRNSCNIVRIHTIITV